MENFYRTLSDVISLSFLFFSPSFPYIPPFSTSPRSRDPEFGLCAINASLFTDLASSTQVPLSEGRVKVSPGTYSKSYFIVRVIMRVYEYRSALYYNVRDVKATKERKGEK